MNILAVDTTGEPLSLALQAGERIFTIHRVFARPHDETLLPAVDRLLDKAGLRLKLLAGIAVASGPGRFTGIRIGMAYAAVAARCIGKPALAITRFEALSFARPEKRFCVVIAGLRGEKYHQAFPGGKPIWSQEVPAGLPIVEGDPTARELLGPAARYLTRGRSPLFTPLYLKPAGYENPKRPRV